MPNTRASARKTASRRDLVREGAESAPSEDNSNDTVRRGHKRTGIPILDNLKRARSGVEELYDQLLSLEQENANLKGELRRVQRNSASGTREQTTARRIQTLERTIMGLKTTHEKDMRVIKKLRESEVKRDAEELRDVQDEASPTRQATDLGESAIKLLRRMCDTIDMNTLAEEEQCDICMEDMQVGKCYSLPCRHPYCFGCFEQLCKVSNTTDDHEPGSVRCPHCRAVCQRDECEIITHTAVQQWDILLDISQQWSKTDIGEMDIREDGEDEGSFIHDGSDAAVESPCISEDGDKAADLDVENSVIPPSPNDLESVPYVDLPSPLKRRRLIQLAAQREARQNIV